MTEVLAAPVATDTRPPDGGWDPYAIELNLRKGGTTHPFLTLQFLTDGAFHMMSALGELGRVGLTAVGESQEQAGELYARTIEILDREPAASGA